MQPKQKEWIKKYNAKKKSMAKCKSNSIEMTNGDYNCSLLSAKPSPLMWIIFLLFVSLLPFWRVCWPRYPDMMKELSFLRSFLSRWALAPTYLIPHCLLSADSLRLYKNIKAAFGLWPRCLVALKDGHYCHLKFPWFVYFWIWKTVLVWLLVVTNI